LYEIIIKFFYIRDGKRFDVREKVLFGNGKVMFENKKYGSVDLFGRSGNRQFCRPKQYGEGLLSALYHK
jgi:hypothetical protein